MGGETLKLGLGGETEKWRICPLLLPQEHPWGLQSSSWAHRLWSWDHLGWIRPFPSHQELRQEMSPFLGVPSPPPSPDLGDKPEQAQLDRHTPPKKTGIGPLSPGAKGRGAGGQDATGAGMGRPAPSARSRSPVGVVAGPTSPTPSPTNSGAQPGPATAPAGHHCHRHPPGQPAMAPRALPLLLLLLLLLPAVPPCRAQHWSHGWYPGGKRDPGPAPAPQVPPPPRRCRPPPCSPPGTRSRCC
ncbi:basic proline-rich protein [Falco peregrinus]|uniref:basic proline-rich protein n=1 Tax=Falco peregrinus TaxID=8954 RepID=UPI00247A25C5|nr:basic proline-rich protein [Falco peregrinus]